MPWLFWLDVSLRSFATTIAAALVIMVVGAGPRRALNLFFAIFLLAEAAAMVFATLMRLSLWLERGDPLLMAELCTMGYALAGPMLLMFTVRYVGRPARRADIMAALGVGIIAFLLVPLFRHHFVVNPRLSPNGAAIVDLTPPAHAAVLIPCAFVAFSLVLFWRERRKTGEPYLALGVLTLLVGFVVGGVLEVAFPVMSFTNFLGIAILGYGVASRQIFNPLRELARELERKVEERTRELKDAYAEVEQRVADRTRSLRQEMSERARAEEAYRTLVDQSLHGIVVVQEGRIVFANPAFAEISGYTVEELLAMSVEQAENLKHPGDRAMVLGYYRNRLAGKPAPSRYEYRLLRKDGKVRWVDVAVRVIEYRGKPAAQVIYADITARKELEERILRAQKLESLGTLAAGVAHNFNNILTAVIGNAQLAQFKLDKSAPAAQLLDASIRAAMRAAQLAKQLLATARRTPGERTVIRPSDLVRGLVEGMAVMLDSNIRLEHRLASDLPPVLGDPVDLEQALMNICVNARDAMPRGGTITITAEALDLDDAFCAAHENMRPGRYICISVADTGIGMDKDTMAGMFDPFFTTKGPDKGTGLGLSSAYGAVVSHGGCIEAESEVGKGSTFRVCLPAAPGAMPETREAGPPAMERGAETVLVVDDETDVLDTLREGLETLGYTVLAAGSGEEAIQIYERDGQKINLVLLDYMMPGLDGEATFYRLKQINPHVKILLSSGYDERTKLGPLLAAGVDGFIQKPYELPALSVAIRRALIGAEGK
ncbi:MAG: PAS domain S-box protein [Planctomycetota bacterium]